MTNKLFEGFNEISEKAWKQKIQFDLKGANYNDSLLWESPEGIHVKPFYHQDGFSKINITPNVTGNQWKIGKEIFINDEVKSLKTSIDSVQRGAEALTFRIPNETIEIGQLLNSQELEASNYFFEFDFIDSTYIDKLSNSNKTENCFLNIDIIGNLAKSGNWFKNLREDHIILENTLTNHAQNFGSVLSVDIGLYQNAGANIVQQLAYGIAHANEYLNHFNTVGKNIVFKVAIGPNYFFEIAKLRALKILWRALISEYELTCNLIISAQPSKRNKTLYDYNNNMLRTTTECMSAILGGANVITNLPYDAIYHKDNEFGSRIARNQLLILRNESYFDKVDNPADGAYYIEDLTGKLAQKALDLFKEIEQKGGFLKHLKEGTIQRKIKENANKEQELFTNCEEVLIGTNKYASKNDFMKDNLELYPFIKTKPRKTLIEPIIEKRLAENIEKERLEKEEH